MFGSGIFALLPLLIRTCRVDTFMSAKLEYLVTVQYQAYRDRVFADDAANAPVPNAKFGSHAKVGLVANDSGDDADAAVVVVRPDGHLAIAVKLTENDQTVQVLEAYFSQFLQQGDWKGQSGSSRRLDARGQDGRLGGGAAYVRSLL